MNIRQSIIDVVENLGFLGQNDILGIDKVQFW